MFKLVVLSVLLAVAAARPSHIATPLVYSAPTVALHEPALATVGSVVKSIPTAVSHQSQSIVHSSAHVVADVVAPVVRTHYAAAPAPLVHTTYGAAPVAPLLHTTYAGVGHAPLTYAASPLATYAAASPLTYTATGVW